MRFNSLDSSIVLNATPKTAERSAQLQSTSASESPIQGIELVNDPSIVETSSYFAPEDDTPPPLLALPNLTTGSIAIRAMRSMRSVARLASWTSGKPTEKENKSTILAPAQEKDNENKRTKAKRKRKLELGRDQTVSRLSGSSSEAGVSGGPQHPHIPPSTTRKSSILGLGLPSGFRFGTIRSSSARSSDRDSQGCSSTVSAASSLRPRSAMSRTSSSSSSSIKWAEDRLETVRVACHREGCHETQRDSKGTHSDVPLEKLSRLLLSKSKSTSPASLPAIAAEEAAVNGYSAPRNEPAATPNRHTRIRPASDQMIGMERLTGIRGVGEGELYSVHTSISRV